MTCAEPRGAELERIKAKHRARPATYTGGPTFCMDCHHSWPCDTAAVFSGLAAEVARLEGVVQAAVAWRNAAPDGGRWYGHELVATSGALVTAVDAYLAALGTKGAGDE